MISNVANERQLAGVYKWTVYTTRLDVDRSVGLVRNLVQCDNRKTNHLSICKQVQRSFSQTAAPYTSDNTLHFIIPTDGGWRVRQISMF